MKYKALREKFASKIFVKPLYKKAKINRIKPKTITIDVRSQLRGHAFENVKICKLLAETRGFRSNRVSNFTNIPTSVIISDYKITKPDKVINAEAKHKTNDSNNIQKRLTDIDSSINTFVSYDRTNRNMSEKTKIKTTEQNTDRIVNDKATDNSSNLSRGPVSWLRLYPAPAHPGEGLSSQVLRCVVCQLGLTAFLVVWTLVWWIIINIQEEPNELKVIEEFNTEQNQLIIDLATELRQISPLSSKWRPIIESRIQQERILTINAVGRGAKLHPGMFWDLSGTFLFTIFVMTAFGFGAPVPQTISGRISSLIYAALAVPMHFYLMVNLSTCIVFQIEKTILQRKKRKERNLERSNPQGDVRTSESFIKPFTRTCLRRKVKRCLSIFCVGRCIPLAIICYYTIGVFIFGYLRDKDVIDAIMFPCEFTTTGGLEKVDASIRILYGIYVEGALSLIFIALTAFKLHSSESVYQTTEKYRLYSHNNYE